MAAFLAGPPEFIPRALQSSLSASSVRWRPIPTRTRAPRPTRTRATPSQEAGGSVPQAPATEQQVKPVAHSQESSSPVLGTMLVSCPDRKGVVAAVGQLLFGMGCNIVDSEQFTDHEAVRYFQRIRFDYSGLHVGAANTDLLNRAVAQMADQYQMDWSVHYATEQKRLAILVSKADHCLWDLLIRHRSGELDCAIPVIISNHPVLKSIADLFNIEFVHIPASSKTAEGKAQVEAKLEHVLEQFQVDTVILARYMQIMSPQFCDKHATHTINIHHSFLPAFEGAKPYHRAYERGVKIIGATAHYATSDLDCGPIIEQDVSRISHKDNVKDMIRKGRDLERLVLSRAVRWHVDNRVIIWGNKTVVFGD